MLLLKYWDEGMFTSCSRVNETQLVSPTSLGYKKKLTLQAPTPQNRQTQLNNSSATADKLFECVWPFCGVGA